jgi:hypothetical protein
MPPSPAAPTTGSYFADPLLGLAKDLRRAREHLVFAVGTLRAAYLDQDSSVPEYRRLRESIAEYAQRYRVQVLPLVGDLVNAVRDTFLDYQSIPPDEFDQLVDDLRAKIATSAELANRMTNEHNTMTDVVQGLRGQAKRVTQRLHEEAVRFEQLQLQHSEAASQLFTWAYDLAYLPNGLAAVSEGALKQADMHGIQSIVLQEERMLAVAAAKAVQRTLIPAMDNLAVFMKSFAGFFHDLERELTRLQSSRCGPDEMDLHSRRMKAAAPSVTSACMEYYKALPLINSQLASLPTGRTNNAVQQWSARHEARYEADASMNPMLSMAMPPHHPSLPGPRQTHSRATRH